MRIRTVSWSDVPIGGRIDALAAMPGVDKAMSNKLLPLVGARTDWVSSFSFTKLRNFLSTELGELSVDQLISGKFISPRKIKLFTSPTLLLRDSTNASVLGTLAEGGLYAV